jgi:formate dehydrogenase major subunit
MINITINGQKITADPNLTILEIVHQNKLDKIPTLCYDPKLPPFGSCFLCVVEVAGVPRLLPACATKPMDGWVIQTRSPKVVDARKTCLELLVSNHYADCFGACRLNCPADVDIQGYLSLTHLGKYHEAVRLIKEKNPFPSVCGRVCTRKCELGCRRKLVDDAVGIDFVKRYASDKDMEDDDMWTPETKPRNGNKVAIVGGGPAGLTCAYYLVLEGYEPTVYEALPEMGGMLRYGIPEYRLPKKVLDKEIKWITDLGVEVHTNTALGPDFTIDNLMQKGYKAAFIGLGAQLAKSMGVANEHVKRVLGGVDFLREVGLGSPPKIHGRVVVVGGGNTAIDAARTSLRLGAKEVVVLYRRTRAEMPANDVEIVAAEEEGVKIHYLAAPVKINSENGELQSMECIEMELGEPDASGRRRPVTKKGSEFVLECDWVISAIGQDSDLSGLKGGDSGDPEIEISKWNTIMAQEGTFGTNRPGVFAGGDVVTGPADAIDAIAAGRLAAFAIMQYIETGHYQKLRPIFASLRDNLKKVTIDDLTHIEKTTRNIVHELPVAERIRTFQEVELPYSAEQVILETCRCVECGCAVSLACQLQDYCSEYGADQKRFAGEFKRHPVDASHPYIILEPNKCINCGRCVRTCADILDVSALGFVYRGFKTIVKPAMEKHLHETNCVSCGNCVDVCPTGAIVNKMPWGRSGPWKMEKVKNVCNFCSVGCNIEINALSPDLFYVTGAFEGEPNFGELCVKGRYGYQQLLKSSRLNKPYIRKEGQLVPATWDEAWQKIKSGLGNLRAENPNGSIMVTASPKLTDEELYLAGKMARTVLKTSAIGSFHRELSGADRHGLDALIGSTSSTCGTKDLENADLVLIVNSDPTTENPVLGWRLKRLMKAGKKAIVISSSENGLTRHASLWLDARRGTASTLLNGIIAGIIRSGREDANYLTSRTANFDRFKRVITQINLDETSVVTGVHPDKIEQAISMITAADQKVVAVYSLDSRIDRSPNDLKALTSLLLVTGKVGTIGNGLILLTDQCNNRGMELAGFDQHLLPGGMTVEPEMVAKLSHIWNDALDCIKQGDNVPTMQKLRDGMIKGAMIFGENPAIDPGWAKRLEQLEFLVVADIYLTETAELADVVLPLNSYVEDEGTITNWEGRRQTLVPLGKPGTGMTNLQMLANIYGIAGGNGLRDEALFEQITREMELFVPKRESELDNIGRFVSRFPTPDGKAHFEVYGTGVSITDVRVPDVLVLDERTNSRLSQLFGQ